MNYISQLKQHNQKPKENYISKLRNFRGEEPKKADIVIIRHGSALHEKTKMGGWTDVPLEPEGVKNAEEAAKNVPKDLDGIVTSDLKRASQTAEIISKKTGIPVLGEDKSLRSWNMGDYAGKSSKEIEPILEKLATQEPDKPIDDGESFNQYKERFLKGVEAIREKYAGKKIGILTHSHGTRILDAWNAKGSPADHSLDMEVYKEKSIAPGGVEDEELVKDLTEAKSQGYSLTEISDAIKETAEIKDKEAALGVAKKIFSVK
jgi:probable phosphoglycerate mutase